MVCTHSYAGQSEEKPCQESACISSKFIFMPCKAEDHLKTISKLSGEWKVPVNIALVN